MSSLIHQLNLFFEVLPERLHRWRWWVLLLYVILMSFLAAGIPRFAFTWANEDMFAKDDPVQISQDKIRELFGGSVILGMAYRPVDGDLFSVRSLGALQNIHKVLDEEATNGADNPDNSFGLLSEVESLINTTYIEVEGDSIRFRDFIGENLPQSPEQSRLLQGQAFKEPEYPRVLFSDNMKYGMLVLRTNLNAIPLVDDELDLLEGFVENEIEEQDEQKPQFVEHGLEDYANFEKQIWNLLSEERFRKDLVFMHPSWGAFYQNDVWAVEYQRALVISLFLSLADISVAGFTTSGDLANHYLCVKHCWYSRTGRLDRMAHRSFTLHCIRTGQCCRNCRRGTRNVRLPVFSSAETASQRSNAFCFQQNCAGLPADQHNYCHRNHVSLFHQAAGDTDDGTAGRYRGDLCFRADNYFTSCPVELVSSAAFHNRQKT